MCGIVPCTEKVICYLNILILLSKKLSCLDNYEVKLKRIEEKGGRAYKNRNIF